MGKPQENIRMAEYIANPEHAAKVQSCIRSGISDHKIICAILNRTFGCNVSENQLRDNYPYELGYTDDEDLAVVAEVAFSMATSGKFPHMTQWWMRVKGGAKWRDDDKKEAGNIQPLVIMLSGDKAQQISPVPDDANSQSE